MFRTLIFLTAISGTQELTLKGNGEKVSVKCDEIYRFGDTVYCLKERAFQAFTIKPGMDMSIRAEKVK